MQPNFHFSPLSCRQKTQRVGNAGTWGLENMGVRVMLVGSGMPPSEVRTRSGKTGRWRRFMDACCPVLHQWKCAYLTIVASSVPHLNGLGSQGAAHIGRSRTSPACRVPH